MDHCIICWRKVRVRKGEHDDLGHNLENNCNEKKDEVAPKSVVTTAPGFQNSFNEIWRLLQNKIDNSAPAAQRSLISLETVVVEGERENTVFSKELPMMCQKCCGKVVAIDNLMKAVRHQFWEIKMLLVESTKRRKEGNLEKSEVDNFPQENDDDCQSDDIQFKQEDEESNLDNQKFLPSSSLLCSEALDSPIPMNCDDYTFNSVESASDDSSNYIKSEEEEQELLQESPVTLKTPKVPCPGPDPLANANITPYASDLLPIGGTLTPITFMCSFPNCDEQFNNYISFTNHQQLCHSSSSRAPKPGPSIPITSSSSRNCGPPRKITKGDTNAEFPCSCGCSIIFKSKRSFNRHLQKIRENPDHKYTIDLMIKTGRAQRCDLCSEPVLYSDLLDHCIGHVGSDEYVVKCPNEKCPQMFLTSVGLQLHLGSGKVCRKIGKEKKTGLMCDTCGFTTDQRLTLRNHVESVHELVGGASSKKEIKCPISGCDKLFNVKQSIYFHLTMHRKIKISKQNCDRCFEGVKVEEMEGHLKDKHGIEEVFGCEHCVFRFSGREELVEHLGEEHRHLGFTCDVCNNNQVKYTRYADFREHIFGVHDLCPKRYKCEEGCGMEFWLKNYKNNHVIKKHKDKKEDKEEKKKKVNCDLCFGEKEKNVWVANQVELISHKIRVHGMEPFGCESCGKTFNAKGKLSRHLKEHAGVEFKKEWRCEVEGCEAKAFTEKRFLKRHTGIYHGEGKKYVCDVCGKAYADKKGLRDHNESVHLKLRPVVCEECGENFGNGNILRTHKLIHTGERPFGCEVCGQRFRHKDVLRRHLVGHEEKGKDFKPNGPMKQLRKRKAK